MSNIWPKQVPAELNKFYGNPDPHHNGVPDRAWEDAHLTAIIPPYDMFLAWAPAQPVKTIRVNKVCADSLRRALKAVADHYGTYEALKHEGLHLYGGAYNFRVMRGGSALSMHSWGCAIDLDPGRNAFGRAYVRARGMMDPAVIDIFAAEGWTWGGKWHTPDSMHFQAANI